MARPKLGLTKKISITLPAESWDWLENKCSEQERSSSDMLRTIIISAQAGSNDFEVVPKNQTDRKRLYDFLNDHFRKILQID